MSSNRVQTERRSAGRTESLAPRLQRLRSTLFPVLAVFTLALGTTVAYQSYPRPNSPFAESELHVIFPNTPTTKSVDPRREIIEGVAQRERAQLGQKVQFLSSIIEDKRVKASDAMMLALTIVNECRKADYDPLFVAAVINAESTFRSQSTSNRGARGLMQILPTTGKYISQKKDIAWTDDYQLHDPDYNIRVGIQYLKYLEKMFSGNREKVLIAYNWGPGNLLDAVKNKRQIPSGPKSYARKVISHHGAWSRLFLVQLAEAESLVKHFG
jgi:hypothetical protein